VRRATIAAAALALLAVAAPAGAQDRKAVLGSFEFQAGQYRPNIDAEPSMPAVGPWESSFGTTRPWMFKFRGGKALFHGKGTLEVGGGVGYMKAKGHGRFDDGTASQEETGFKLLPLTLDLTYRLDQTWEEWGVPLVPYARLALLRDHWWVTGSGGKQVAKGVTNGWGWGGGLALVLDFIDATLARELDRDAGIKHTMLVVEVQQNHVKDFGSSSSWDISSDDVFVTYGLMFAF
jgi:hypothetical protein